MNSRSSHLLNKCLNLHYMNKSWQVLSTIRVQRVNFNFTIQVYYGQLIIDMVFHSILNYQLQYLKSTKKSIKSQNQALHAMIWYVWKMDLLLIARMQMEITSYFVQIKLNIFQCSLQNIQENQIKQITIFIDMIMNKSNSINILLQMSLY